MIQIDKIGKKGIGTKTFYKNESIHLELKVKKDSILLIAHINKPGENLQNNNIPIYKYIKKL